MSDFQFLLFCAGILLIFLFVFARISTSLRRGGGSLTPFMLGTTAEFYSTTQLKAAGGILNDQANKQLEEQESGEPEAPGGQSAAGKEKMRGN